MIRVHAEPGGRAGGARRPAAPALTGLLALQRTAGNRAVTRALQRAPVYKVMPLDHSFFTGYNEAPGYVVRRGIPRGFHVTLYASNLTSAQYSAALSQPLGKLPDYHTIEFTSFNVTRESDDKHYFDESGNVVWAQTRREAALEDGDWEQAVAAAVRIYTDLGLVVSEASLYKQLHDMGRKAPVSARDVIAAPKPKPVTVTSPTAFKPRSLLVGRPKAPAPPTATPKPFGAVWLTYPATDVPMASTETALAPAFEHEDELEQPFIDKMDTS